jgi:predicted SprT family Zn-dependent metalloprotease
MVAADHCNNFVSYDPNGTAKITVVEYGNLQRAYDFFNVELFESTLPSLLITLHRKRNTLGYFSRQRFQARKAGDRVHELALNPDGFSGRSDEYILSVLVHEMAHAWQETCGKPGRGRYHNCEWGQKMKAIGLHPSNTGEPGGKEIGDQMMHYILPEGRFRQSYRRLETAGFHLHWQSGVPIPAELSKVVRRKLASKTKFTCPTCCQNAWAKADADLICGSCILPMASAEDNLPLLG